MSYRYCVGVCMQAGGITESLWQGGIMMEDGMVSEVAPKLAAKRSRQLDTRDEADLEAASTIEQINDEELRRDMAGIGEHAMAYTAATCTTLYGTASGIDEQMRAMGNQMRGGQLDNRTESIYESGSVGMVAAPDERRVSELDKQEVMVSVIEG